MFPKAPAQALPPLYNMADAIVNHISGLHVGQNEGDEGVERGSEAINDGDGGVESGGVGVGGRGGGDVRGGGRVDGIDGVDEATWIKDEADGKASSWRLTWAAVLLYTLRVLTCSPVKHQQGMSRCRWSQAKV